MGSLLVREGVERVREAVPMEADRGFEVFFEQVEPPLQRALAATYGPEVGREATAEAMAWAWEHRDRLAGLERPVAYLYRVGQSRVRRRRVRVPFLRAEDRDPQVEPALMKAVAALSGRQRVAVVLVHGYAWRMAEVAELLGVSVSTVQTHLDRGLRRLRTALGEEQE